MATNGTMIIPEPSVPNISPSPAVPTTSPSSLVTLIFVSGKAGEGSVMAEIVVGVIQSYRTVSLIGAGSSFIKLIY